MMIRQAVAVEHEPLVLVIGTVIRNVRRSSVVGLSDASATSFVKVSALIGCRKGEFGNFGGPVLCG